MITKSRLIFPFLIVWILFSCDNEKIELKPAESYFQENAEKEGCVYLSSKSIVDENGNKKTEEIKYSMGVVSATEFVHKKKKNISQNELNKLKKESVAILEFELIEEHKTIYEAKRNPLGKDRTIEYLIGAIKNDITIDQNGTTYIPNDLLFENSFSKQNRIRLYFFFTGVNLNEEMKIMYHDRLYGAGLINFRINKNHDI